MIRGLMRVHKQIMELPEEERRDALRLVARILRRSEDGLRIPEHEARELGRLQQILFFKRATVVTEEEQRRWMV